MASDYTTHIPFAGLACTCHLQPAPLHPPEGLIPRTWLCISHSAALSNSITLLAPHLWSQFGTPPPHTHTALFHRVPHQAFLPIICLASPSQKLLPTSPNLMPSRAFLYVSANSCVSQAHPPLQPGLWSKAQFRVPCTHSSDHCGGCHGALWLTSPCPLPLLIPEPIPCSGPSCISLCSQSRHLPSPSLPLPCHPQPLPLSLSVSKKTAAMWWKHSFSGPLHSQIFAPLQPFLLWPRVL